MVFSIMMITHADITIAIFIQPYWLFTLRKASLHVFMYPCTGVCQPL